VRGGPRRSPRRRHRHRLREHARLPEELRALLPADRYGHSCEFVDFEAFRGRRVTIVGGRQSAFESAALLIEAGAREVNLVYRHDTPRFEESDWSWVDALMARTETEPAWYRELPDDARRELNARFWAEGRLKLEPWLAPRIDSPAVRLWPHDEIVGANAGESGLALRLRSGATVAADFVLLGTGYRVDLARLPLLAPPSNLAGRVATKDGSPVLDTALQSSIPGLYFTSIAATRDFGPFFAFTVSARSSARLLGAAVSPR
jgi:cation diffusion facilitator CzcD-associated flavoprotein CzcO